MKHIRLRVSPSEGTIHPLFSIMINEAIVSFAEMIDWNIGDSEQPTMLFAIEGDRERIETQLDATTEVSTYDITSISPSQFYLRIYPLPIPLTRELFELYETEDLIIIHPIVYRDGAAHVSLLGESAELQEAVRRFSSGLDVTIEQVSNFFPRPETVVSHLSARQKETLEIAFERGYYEYPRQTTHKEIADVMGCAANTVSVHLQKAEAKVISDVLSYSEYQRTLW